MQPLHVAWLLVLLLRLTAAAVVPATGHGSSKADALALLSAKSALSDPAGSLASWNTTNRLCSWRGVMCGHRHPDRVVALRMNSLGLGGRVSPFFGNLSFLRLLDLGSNSLTGRIPAQLGRLERLQVLNLSVNSLEGNIPSALGRCTQLTKLNLNNNYLHGEIPGEAISSLQNLVYLNLLHNDLSGEIPPSLGNLSSIQQIGLGFNALSGAIPSSLGELPNLYNLFLSFNNLTGSIPHTLWNSSSLIQLAVFQNDLGGTIPADAFDRVPRLQVLIMGFNQFHGHIPSSVVNASNFVSFQLEFNYFSGPIPSELGRLKGLQQLYLVSNALEAKEPKDWNFMTALTNCSQLQEMQLDFNRLVGELPSSVANLSTSLERLSLSHNQIFGPVPEKISNLIGLQTLALEYNSLSGPLPSSMGMLHNLQYLSLSTNNLGGDIRLIGNFTQLVYLYIENNFFNGSIPITLGNLESLVEFNLSRNNFTGRIPSELLNVPSLAHLVDFSYNLLEGPIPPEIGNLKSVSFFYADSNQLSGEIPSTIGECQLLQNLFLQNNFLSGTLPQLLSGLKNLQLCGGIFDLHLPPCSFERSKKIKKKVPVTPIVVPFAAIISILLFLYFFLTWKKRRPTSHNPSTAPMQRHPLLTYSQLATATNGFSATNLLGVGTFGAVYRGELDGSSNETASFVAVKVLKLQTPGAAKSFVAECEAMRNIRHRNLVKIITTCSSIDYKGDDFKAIVFEFMPNGSLEGWLHPGASDRSGERHMSLLQRVNILFDVAHALDYLHFNGATPIVHCDLKPSNVLLDIDMVAHVGDFGLARILAEGCSSFQPSTSSMGFKGTIGYAPPEYGAGNIVSTHGDIYSYGILVLEMITGKRPTNNAFEGVLGLREHVEMALNNSAMDIIDIELLRELENDNSTAVGPSIKRSVDSLLSLLKLGSLCSVETPSSRMSTKEIIKQLHEIKRALNQGDGR
ncbi:hypothetical protein ACP70R_037233 [Stipagrostis hirtigluma subsp. patula]